MKNKLLSKTLLFGLTAVAALGLVGCGHKEDVTFGQYSGTYDNNSYSVAASTWEKQKDQEGFDGVWKLTGTVQYDDNTGKALYYGSADTKHFVAITVKHDDKVKVEEPKFYVNDTLKKTFDNGNKETFTLVKAISQETQDFTIKIEWNKDTTVKYKFLLDKESFTLEPAPQE